MFLTPSSPSLLNGFHIYVENFLFCAAAPIYVLNSFIPSFIYLVFW